MFRPGRALAPPASEAAKVAEKTREPRFQVRALNPRPPRLPPPEEPFC
jgi:hypothetical protein